MSDPTVVEIIQAKRDSMLSRALRPFKNLLGTFLFAAGGGLALASTTFGMDVFWHIVMIVVGIAGCVFGHTINPGNARTSRNR